MAQRWTGNLAIRILYSDQDQQYRARICTIRKPRECETVFVGPPAHLERAVDHPIAYDEAARAAVAFAEELTEHADFLPDGSGIAIHRGPLPGKARSWGKHK